VKLVLSSFPRASDISSSIWFISLVPRNLIKTNFLCKYCVVSKHTKWLVAMVFYVQSHSCLKLRTPSDCDYKYAHEVLICVFDVDTQTTDKSCFIYGTQWRSSNIEDEGTGVIKVYTDPLQSKCLNFGTYNCNSSSRFMKYSVYGVYEVCTR